MAEEIGDQQIPIIDDQEDAPGYQAPPQKSISEILQADEDDESLRKYKAALLGTDAEPIIVGESILLLFANLCCCFCIHLIPCTTRSRVTNPLFMSCSPSRSLRPAQGDCQEAGAMRSRPGRHGTGSDR